MSAFKVTFLTFSLFYLFWSIGCAPFIFIKSNINHHLSYEVSQGIFIDNTNIKTVADENFRYLLFQKMKQNGFQLSETARQLVLVFELSDIVISDIIPVPYAPIKNESERNYFGLKYDCSVLFYGLKRIYLKIEKRGLPSDKTGIPLWDATIDVEQDTYDKYKEQLAEMISLNIGKSIQGKINLKNFK